jgi:hypothetical protein
LVVVSWLVWPGWLGWLELAGLPWIFLSERPALDILV